MPENHRHSRFMRQAAAQLEEVMQKKLSPEEREKGAVALAASMLREATRIQSFKEKRLQAQLARMMHDAKGKAFTTYMTDQCFRSSRSPRIADQMIFLIHQLGVPSYLSLSKRLQLSVFEKCGHIFSHLFVPLAILGLRSETSSVILPGERAALSKHMEMRRQQGVRINLNHLGEAILGEREAKRRLDVYLHDLEQKDVEYISVKISTIFSQINLLAWEKNLNTLSD